MKPKYSAAGIYTFFRLTKVESYLIVNSTDKDTIGDQTKARGVACGDALAVWGHFMGGGHAAALIHTAACEHQVNTKSRHANSFPVVLVLHILRSWPLKLLVIN